MGYKNKKIIREMSNEEYRSEIMKIFEKIQSNRLLRYFYISALQKAKNEKSVDYQVSTPDYDELIIEMLPKVNSEKYLRRIYLFIKGFLEQG